MSTPYLFLKQGEAASEAGMPTIATDIGSLLEILHQGGILIWPILFCSIIVLAYAVERLIGLRRRRIVPPKLVASLEDAVSRGRVDEAMRLCEEDKSPFAAIAGAGIRVHEVGTHAEVEKAMEDAGLREVMRLRKNVRPLATVGSIAPLLGLLGTVLGMIEAFNVVAGGGMGQQELLASGIAKALVTTGAGLSVAIPALTLYYYLSGRVQNIVLQIDERCSRLVHALPRRHAVGAPGAAASSQPKPEPVGAGATS